MAERVPKVLILGHSFVKRLQSDLEKKFDHRVSTTFGLVGTAEVHLYGVGCRTVAKIKNYDLEVVRQLKPDVVILEVGTNDLSSVSPEVVGSSIEDLVVTLKSVYSVSIVCVCHVIPRGESTLRPNFFLGVR